MILPARPHRSASAVARANQNPADRRDRDEQTRQHRRIHSIFYVAFARLKLEINGLLCQFLPGEKGQRYVRALLDPRRDHRPATKRIRIERKWEEGVRGRRLETASAVKRADEGGFVRAGCLRWLSGAKMSAGVRSVCNSRAVRPAAFCRQRRKAANIREDAYRGRMSKNGVRPPRLSDLSRVFQPSDYGTV
uniref:Uncharacterized protein n=1 Tax=Plectus sambesii TaxID=2011161 RepID=A0A914X6Y5_9BILA